MKEREESNEESDAGGEKEEDESVKPEVPACTELTDILNKLVNPETNDLADDIDEDELEGVQVAPNVGHEPTTLRLRFSCSTD